MTWSTIYPILYWQSWLENWVFPLYTKFFESGLKFGIRWCLICWSFLMFARKPRKKTKIQPEKKRWWCLCFAENVTWGSIICLHKGIWFNNLCPVLTVRKGWFHFRFSSPKKNPENFWVKQRSNPLWFLALGWGRGRWDGWDVIFSDIFAGSTFGMSDPWDLQWFFRADGSDESIGARSWALGALQGILGFHNS